MNKKDSISRRDFLGRVVAGTGAAMAAPHALQAKEAAAATAPPTATDLVPVGKSGLKLCRLGMGTGSRGGKIQRDLGQKEFTKLVEYALDRGVRFIDTADNYQELHEMIRPAIKGVDRETIQIQCKIPHGKYDDPLKELDRFRREVGTDYFDSLLIHCVRTGDWPEERKRLMDLLEEAKEKQVIRAAGVSMHGLPPLRATAESEWGDVRLVRINHNGASMDNLQGRKGPGDVDEVVKHIRSMHAAGKGIIGMKLIGNGDFTDPKVRKDSINFVVGLGCVDAMVIGFKAPGEIDEAIANINAALKQKT